MRPASAGAMPPPPSAPWHEAHRALKTCCPWARNGSEGVGVLDDPHAARNRGSATVAATANPIIRRRRRGDGEETCAATTPELYRPPCASSARAGATWPPSDGDTCPMGFNPHRTHRRSPADYVMVAGAFAVVIALILWALLG